MSRRYSSLLISSLSLHNYRCIELRRFKSDTYSFTWAGNVTKGRTVKAILRRVSSQLSTTVTGRVSTSAGSKGQACGQHRSAQGCLSYNSFNLLTAHLFHALAGGQSMGLLGINVSGIPRTYLYRRSQDGLRKHTSRFLRGVAQRAVNLLRGSAGGCLRQRTSGAEGAQNPAPAPADSKNR